MKLRGSSRSSFLLHKRASVLRTNRKFSINSSDQFQSGFLDTESTSTREAVVSVDDDEAAIVNLGDTSDYNALQPQLKMFRNRFLDFVRIRSVINNAAESFFKSEIRRRLFVTAVLIVFSRVGYYIPLPGFDRRLMPQDYLSFTSGSVGEFAQINADTNTMVQKKYHS